MIRTPQQNGKAMPQFVVFGNPISHSLSPQLHRLFAQQFNMTIDYQTQLAPLNQFEKTVDAFRQQGGLGANITHPFKTSAFAYADQLTDRAIIAGAVNTFIFHDHYCRGDNTDGVGLLRDLQNHAITLQNKTILILGAGGATRGILSGLIKEKPAHIFIYNRTHEKTESLINHFKKYFSIEIFSQENKVDLIINATAMNFQTDFNSACDLENTVCYDLNYGKRHTPFYEWATHNKAQKIYDGLGMLIEQGAESFFEWFGKRPNTTGFPDSIFPYYNHMQKFLRNDTN